MTDFNEISPRTSTSTGTLAAFSCFLKNYNSTVAVYSWSIAINFVIDVYCKCLQILFQIAFSSTANYFRPYRKKQFGIKSVGIYRFYSRQQ